MSYSIKLKDSISYIINSFRQNLIKPDLRRVYEEDEEDKNIILILWYPSIKAIFIDLIFNNGEFENPFVFVIQKKPT